MDASSLYSLVKSYAQQNDTIICVLHNAQSKIPCVNSGNFCGHPSQTAVINFDAVKTAYCKNENIHPQLKSVDAFTHKNGQILFVEIKSNKNFLRYQLKQTDPEETVDEKIRQQVANYQLKKKIDNSRTVCEAISGDSHLFDTLPSIYVLVTDAETVTNPLQSIQINLNILAYNAIYLPRLNKALEEDLDSLGHTTRLVYCQDFDKFISSL